MSDIDDLSWWNDYLEAVDQLPVTYGPAVMPARWPDPLRVHDLDGAS